ncbi:zinc ribbon domain-containing protein [Halobaculum magnesiiphilum]|uniref:Zinc ribbon domain-containing protein n=1 Tax=Halobaculum magnesiiphilum TaxID=1017351 RepID=A0A8T8WF82_9EURY|nr:zinc ribbon domain-containing protein [Halobaculum magnesiiphilum]QZP38436.1 zinc ribbon domain-containing protein [Halobaculum magnesiiphilum]
MPSRSTAAGGSHTCEACGTRIDPEDRFCSGCGRPVGSTDRDGPERGSGRGHGSPSAEDRAWLRRRVADLHAEGWETLSDDGERVVLRKRGVGRVPIHLLLFLLTGGFGNVLYAFYKYTSGAPRREVYADGTERLRGGDRGSGMDLPTVAGVGLGLVAAFAAAVWVGAGLIANVSAVALAVGALVFLLIALATATLPRVARDGVRSVRTFGTERAVDRERVRNPPEPCSACGRRVFRGEHRRYAERFYLAGLPLWTEESGENVYCSACADEANGPFDDDDDIDAELDRLRSTTERGRPATDRRTADRDDDRDGDTDDDRDRELDSNAS